MTDAIMAFLILLGCLFALIGGLGLVRLPDVLIRMHASTKIGTLACGLIMSAAAIHFGTGDMVIRAVSIILFLLLTAPIAAHMIGRAAVSTGVKLWGRPDGLGPNAEDRADELPH
ncbi:MAG: monovalent cation/H(+) antiporter subunit G [Pseudomonadota bacterium]